MEWENAGEWAGRTKVSGNTEEKRVKEKWVGNRNQSKVRRRCCSFQRNNKTNGKNPKQSELRKSESWLGNTQRKDKVHDKPCRQRRHTKRSAKN